MDASVCPIAYMHLNGKYGVILNFDIKGNDNRDAVNRIGKDLAMQIASMLPDYLSQGCFCSLAVLQYAP